MPPAPASLRSFLVAAKKTLQNVSPQSGPLTFVVGNESADLDSLCSAVVLAYIRTHSPSTSSTDLYIPLSHLPRADLSLRPELHPVLHHANLKPNDLITLSDLPQTPLTPENTRWLLVDHNALQGQLGKQFNSRVVGCIDHHDEENQVPADCGHEPRIVEKSGSCTSLVIEYCKEAWDGLVTKTEERQEWDSELARLAIAPILIDTTNLTDEYKTTLADREGVEYLESKIQAQGGEYNRTEYFEEISAAKRDIDKLSLNDILRKDYKEWTEANSTVIGISSVVKDISYLIEKAGSKDTFFEAVKQFSEERDLSICSIMTTSNPDGVFKRELFIWALNEHGIAATKKFDADSTEELGLRSWKAGSLDVDEQGNWRRCWWQEKVEHSRKQVGPLLRNAVGK